MFHWICPECGREIPPSVRECQACDPSAAAPNVVEPVEAATAAAVLPEPPPLPETAAVPIAAAPEPVAEQLLLLPATPDTAPVAATPLPLPAVELTHAEAPQVAAHTAEVGPAVAVAAPIVEPAVETAIETPISQEAKPVPVAEEAKATPAAAEPVLEEAPVTEPVAPVAAVEPEVAVEAPVAVAEVAPAENVVEPPAAQAAPVEPEVVEQKPSVIEAAPVENIVEEPVSEAPVSHEPIAQTEPVEPAPAAVAEEKPPAEVTPGVVANAAPVDKAVEEPVLETAPVVETVAHAGPVEPTPAPAEEQPQAAPANTAPVEDVVAEPAQEVALIGEPTVQPVAEEQPAITEPTPIPVADAAPVEKVPEEPVPAAAATEQLPVVEAASAGPAPIQKAEVQDVQEAPIKLHDVPDPLLALAEEIRAAQAARAAALATPPSSSGLMHLAEAVGVQEQSPEPPVLAQPVDHVQQAEPVAHAEPVSQPVEQSAPAEKTHVAEEAAVAVAEVATAVALLAPPEPQPTAHIAQEPVGFHELRPAALAPEPLPTAEPEPVVPAEPQVQPVALAPEPQPEPEPQGPTLPFAPMQDYTPATSRSIMPVPPPQQILSAESGPRITLPGPTLPPELTRLQDANVVTVIGEDTAQRTKEAIPPPKRDGAPGWVVSVLVMLLLLAAGLGVVFYLLPHTVADAKPAPTPAVAATGPAPTSGNSPLVKFVEVTGFRIVTSSPDANKKDATKKSEVQYLIVNHSDADISDANVFVTLRSAKPGQAPLCRFSFKVPSLGPFESKEMSSPIGNATHAISLPDWQDIRAEVQISQ